jgi:small subunit ribosomal protein S2
MTENKTKKENMKIDVEEMSKLGLQLGHKTSRIHPKMNQYISGVKNGTHIIDLEKTKQKLVEALTFIQSTLAESKSLVLVGTKIQIKEILKETAEACSLPYVSERWLGGTFTNIQTINKRIEYYKELERKKATGELDKYTKKERANFDQELKNLEKKFSGIKNISKLADAVFICDMIKDKLAVKEARIKGVKIIAICDTNTDPSLVDYPIPASDDAISSVGYILGKIREAVLEVKPKTEK